MQEGEKVACNISVKVRASGQKESEQHRTDHANIEQRRSSRVMMKVESNEKH